MTEKKCFIIAEAGTAHGGDPRKADDLIHAAAEAGADCVKFQLVIADEIIHPKTGFVPLPGGKIPLYERFKSLEQPPEFYGALKEHAEKSGIRFLCTPFGIQSARILRNLGVDMLKIASPEVNHVPLLTEAAAYGLPIILSTGVSTLGDIDEALRVLRSAAPGKTRADCTLLHCITAYPAPEEEYNLRCIPNLAAVFGVPAGVSDHSLDPVLVPALSVTLGASVIEKHICLSRDTEGLDDPIALPPDQFTEMVRRVRRTEEAPHKEQEELRLEYGPERINAVLGDGVKGLSPSERANYGLSNRSVHALTDLPAGAVLSPKNTAILRTEKTLTPGLHPRYYSVILGKRLVRPVESGEGITWEDLLS